MLFNDRDVAFGRHETFQLRYGWLTKGFQELQKNSAIFTSDDATVRLGVGKNMVNSIRYWMLATQVAKPVEKGMMVTELGKAIFAENGFDPYLEDEATIWLVHWLLASNSTIATSWYWFFNHFHKPEFTNKEVADGLHEFAKQKIKSKFSQGTLKKDIDIILRMYTRSKSNAKQPVEDSLDSPLSILSLVSQVPGTKSYYSFPDDRNRIPLGVIGFAVASIFEETESDTIPIENLMYMKGKHPALGAVFRLTENSLLAKLELLEHYMPHTFKVSESAGIHQLTRVSDKHVAPMQFLEKHYREYLEVAA